MKAASRFVVVVVVVVAVVVVIALATSSSLARASTRKNDFPCKGCITALPDASADAARAPLLVVLHGDGGAPATILAVWEKAAVARGLVVFAPKCPVDDGCAKGSWWQWGKDPKWFDAPIDAIDAVRPIDRKRMWIAGWSGGASYLGWRAPDLVGRFAAVSIEGGGMAPRDPQECVKGCTLDSYFLVGDKNPLHDLAKDLRGWFDGCNEGSLTWDLLPGADHGGEWLALNKSAKLGAILDWFEARSLTCAVAAAPPTTSTVEAAVDAPIAPTPSFSASSAIGMPSIDATKTDPPVRATRCTCDAPGGSTRAPWLVALAMVTCVIRRGVPGRSKNRGRAP